MMFSRRETMKLMMGAASATTLSGRSSRAADKIADPKDLTTPNKAQLAWQDLELGMFIHFGMQVFQGIRFRHQWGKSMPAPDLYNPRKLDTDQWLEAAKAMGARYAVFVAKHNTGFLQWQSDLYPYGCKQTSWRGGKGDTLDDFVKSCREYGIKPGVYASTAGNAFMGAADNKANFGKGGDVKKQQEYIKLCERMLEEIWSRYGDLVEVWFDGGVLKPGVEGPDLKPLLAKHLPDAMSLQGHVDTLNLVRWNGNEKGCAPYPCWSTITRALYLQRERAGFKFIGDPAGEMWVPTECDAVLRGRKAHDWFWRPNREHTIHTVDELMWKYLVSVGRNSNLLLNATPNRDGLIPDADMKRYEEFGKELKRVYGHELAAANGEGMSLEVALPKPASVSRMILMEDIAHGERIRKYEVEGLVPGNTWQKLSEGTCVGHKRIEEFNAVEVAKARIVVKESVGTPKIRKLALLA